MMYAETAEGRVEAAPGLAGTCPSCGHPCRPKCGKLITWHWAHYARADCDPWSEPMTEWHLGWQRAVPSERREVVMGPHRADILTASGGVVEIQHSTIPVDTITEREEFYGQQMAWIFDATQAAITISAVPPMLVNTPCGCADEHCFEIWLPPGTACQCQHEGCTGYMRERQWKPFRDVWFQWKRTRASLVACRRPVFLDLGNGTVLRIRPYPAFTPATGMPGALYTRMSVEGWLRDGTPLERIILPAEEPVSEYDPLYMEQARIPGAWQAAQEQQRADWLAARWAPAAAETAPEEAPGPPAAGTQAVTTEKEWLAAILRIVPDVGMEACGKLQRETTEKYRKGELAEPDAVKVLNLIKARMEALEGAPQVTQPVPAPATARLDPRPQPTRRLPIWHRIRQAFRGRHDGPTRRPPPTPMK